MQKFGDQKLLYKDIKEGRVLINSQQTIALQEIYCTYPEYAKYQYKKSSVQKCVKNNTSRAKEDTAVFDLYVKNNEVSYHSHKGYIQWQGSKSQQLLQKYIMDELVE